MTFLITLVCWISIISAVFTVILNINLLKKVVMKKPRKTDENMPIFYYRFTIDTLFGLFLIPYIIFILLTLQNPGILTYYSSLIVILPLPSSNLSTCRSIIALAISIDRALAVYFPIIYRNHRKLFPNLSILIASLSFGLFEDLVLFGICSYDMTIPPGCRAFGCAVNRCFYKFWTSQQTVVFCATVVMSILLSVKLFVWNNLKHGKANRQLEKANRLALLDIVTVFLFDFLPSLCASMWPSTFSFDHVGPYNAAGKSTGCAIESIVVTSVLLLKNSVSQEQSSLSTRNLRLVKGRV